MWSAALSIVGPLCAGAKGSANAAAKGFLRADLLFFVGKRFFGPGSL
jgi:hypothetical protein